MTRRRGCWAWRRFREKGKCADSSGSSKAPASVVARASAELDWACDLVTNSEQDTGRPCSVRLGRHRESITFRFSKTRRNNCETPATRRCCSPSFPEYTGSSNDSPCRWRKWRRQLFRQYWLVQAVSREAVTKNERSSRRCCRLCRSAV